MKEVKEHYTIIDRRLEDEPKEVCRVCGAEEVHSKEYNTATMKCIKYLREEIKRLEKV